MNVVRLTSDYTFSDFDCGDADLNNFLIEDAKGFLDKRIANSFILEDKGKTVGYFCLLNDKISKETITNSQWKKIKGRFPDGKRFSSYPAIKIGRFAISKDYRGQNMGTMLMELIKSRLDKSINYSAFRFITVDAYLSAIDFYIKNGFSMLTQKEENNHTRLMFFDMMSM